MKEIATEQGLIASTGVELNKQWTEFTRKVGEGKADLADTLRRQKEDLSAAALELKESALKEAIVLVQAKLKDQESGIKEQIMGPLVQIRDDDVAALRKSLEGVSNDVAAVGTAAKAQQETLKDATAAVARLVAMTAGSDKLALAIKNIEEDESAAREAKNQALEQMRSAKGHEQSAREAG